MSSSDNKCKCTYISSNTRCHQVITSASVPISAVTQEYHQVITSASVPISAVTQEYHQVITSASVPILAVTQDVIK